jgi:hypothetical protein
MASRFPHTAAGAGALMRARTMTFTKKAVPLGILLLLGACATIPDGPSVMAMPGSGKSFAQFNQDDDVCRQYASGRIGGKSAQEAANDAGISSAVVGTLIGAVAGGAIGGNNGAAVGAGTGLIVGSAAGANATAATGYTMQQRYDNAYIQCMYANGEKVPVAAGEYRRNDYRRRRPYYDEAPPPPPPPDYGPPPPGMTAPPPPPPPY